MQLKEKVISIYYDFVNYLKRLNWTMLFLGIISILLADNIFDTLSNNSNKSFNSHDSLELILTINGLFSAILVTYFFNRVSWILESKKEDYNNAIFFSQKITDFRRILNELTKYYNLWESDDATMRLLESKKYKHIDYYDYKLMSYSDYSPKNKKVIEELLKEKNYQSGQSDLFLGMISLVTNRKNIRRTIADGLYKDFQRKEIYKFDFIEKCMEIEYGSRLWYWFDKDYDFIRYEKLSAKSQKYILDTVERIDNKYKGVPLNNALMADLCDDMNEHYFKELYELLSRLRKGLTGINLLIFCILIASLTFGVLFPFLIYFVVENDILKNSLTKLIIGLNFGLLFFFTTNLYGIVKKEITWS